MTRVKICGITNLEDAEAAVQYGADALGFIFAESPRRVTPPEVERMTGKIGPQIMKVGVFVNESVPTMQSIAHACGLNIIQLHGEESADVAESLKPLTVIKVFRVGEHFSQDAVNRYPSHVAMLETYDALRGGSGKSWDWQSLAKVKFTKPIVVTGGLNPDNVHRAIEILKPHAVDVSSGVEKTVGIKDHQKLKAFIQNAKEIQEI